MITTVTSKSPIKIGSTPQIQPQNNQFKLKNSAITNDTFTPSFKGNLRLPITEIKELGIDALATIKKLKEVKGTDGIIIKKELPTIAEKGDMMVDYSTAVVKKIDENIAPEVIEENEHFLRALTHEMFGSFFSGHASTIMNAEDLSEKAAHKIADSSFKKVVNHVNKSIDLYQFFLDHNLNKKPIGTKKLFAKARNLCMDLAKEKNIKIIIKDPILMEKYDKCTLNDMDNFVIVSNLIANAVKYSPKNSTVELGLKVKNNKLLFTIKDQGIGIPQELQKELFNTIRRADNVGEIPGSGYGLFAIGRIIKNENLEAPKITSPLYPKADTNKGTMIEIPLLSKVDQAPSFKDNLKNRIQNLFIK